MQMLISSPAHFCPTSPLQVTPNQRRNQVSKVNNMFFFHFIAQYDEFTAVNNQGSGQYDWPPPLINLTTHSSSQLSPPPNHLIDHLRSQSALSCHWTTTYCTPPSLHIASMLALCSSLLSDSQPLPPLLTPSNETASVTPLYSPSPSPLPCSRLHHSKAGDAVGWA